MKLRRFGISVVIPTYNRIDKLIRAVDSVCSEHKNCVEIIIVDDCSEIPPERFIDNRNRYGIPVRIYKNSRNSGPQICRNLGIRRSAFEFVAFLDSDDYFHPHKINWLLDILSNKDIDFLYHAVKGCEKYNKISRLWFRTFGRLIHFKWFLCLLNPCVTPSVVIKKKKCLFNPSLRYSEDYAFFLSYIDAGVNVSYFDKEFTTVPREIGSSGGISGNLIAMRKGEIQGKKNLLRKTNCSKFFQFIFSMLFTYVRIISDIIRKRYNIIDFINS